MQQQNIGNGAALPSEGYVRIGKIVAPDGVIPVSRATWWAGIKSGRFPRGTKLGPNTTAWDVRTIRALIAKLAEQEQKVLAKLNAHLLAVADIDPDTGSPTNVKRWEDFDENGDGFLQPKEHGKASIYAAKKAAAKGEWGMASKIGLGSGGGMAILAIAETARRRKRKPKPGDPPDGPAPAIPPVAGPA